MTEDQIKHMVDRFLQWRFPDDMSPDGGLSFKRFSNEGTSYEHRYAPVGTNLLSAVQATAMVLHLVEGLQQPTAMNKSAEPVAWRWSSIFNPTDWSVSTTKPAPHEQYVTEPLYADPPSPDTMRKAAQAVIDRWETPAWKDRPATATYINALRAALSSAPVAPAAPSIDSVAQRIERSEPDEGRKDAGSTPVAISSSTAPVAGTPDQWQDISTAPKDGTRILAWSEALGVRETYWHLYGVGSPAREACLEGNGPSGAWNWDEPQNHWSASWKPTLWMSYRAPAISRKDGGSQQCEACDGTGDFQGGHRTLQKPRCPRCNGTGVVVSGNDGSAAS